jgi:hypothetical protein
VMLRITVGPDTVPPRLTQVYTMADSLSIELEFNESLERASAERTANYSLDHGIIITAASLLAGGKLVRLSLSPALDSGASYLLSVGGIKDAAGNSIASNSTASFTYLPAHGISKIRFYPRSGWEPRMAGGVFEGTNGDKDSGPYSALYTVNSTPAAGWNETTNLTNNIAAFRYIRYRSPDNGYCNVSEIEFYRGNDKITGTAFGTPGSWNNSGADFTKAFDGIPSTYFDCPSPNGAYTGIEVKSGTTLITHMLIGAPQIAGQEKTTWIYDLKGRLITRDISGKTAAGIAPTVAGTAYIIKMSNGIARKSIQK